MEEEIIIVENRVAQKEDTKFLKKLYRLVDEYHDDHPDISVMIVAGNPKDKIGIGFLVGEEGIVARELGKLATLYQHSDVQPLWEELMIDAYIHYQENKK